MFVWLLFTLIIIILVLCNVTSVHAQLLAQAHLVIALVCNSISAITRYGSTLYIGIAMVVPIPQYIRKCQFLLSVSSEFDF